MLMYVLLFVAGFLAGLYLGLSSLKDKLDAWKAKRNKKNDDSVVDDDSKSLK